MAEALTQRSHIQCPTRSHSHTRNLHLAPTTNSLSISSSLSYFPFPLTFSSSSRSNNNNYNKPSQSQTLHDSTCDNYLLNSANLLLPNTSQNILIPDTPWIWSLFPPNTLSLDKTKYNRLRRRQIKEETEAWERALAEYRQMERDMCRNNLAPNLPFFKSLLLGWFEPFTNAIANEQMQHEAKSEKTRKAYAPHIDSLPAEKMAIIVMHKLMQMIMSGQEEGYVPVVHAALHIGMAIEQEVRIRNFLDKTKKKREDITQGPSKQEMLRKRVNSLIKSRKLFQVHKLVRAVEFEPWDQDVQAKLGCHLLQLLIETAYVRDPISQSADDPPNFRPAFTHKRMIFRNGPGKESPRRYKVIECDPLLLTGLDRSAKHMLIPYMPMLIPPTKWKGYDKGGYLFLPSYIMRTHGSRKQQEAVKKAPAKQMQKVFEALDMLGNTKWRVNKRVLSVVETLWAKGGNIAGLVDCEDLPTPEKPLLVDSVEIQKWKWSARKAKKINQERNSQRCDIELKLSVARKLVGEEGFYYPHNLDFRGRAYPMHPHLNHLNSDLCRGVLEFAEGRPLGRSGLRWLKIHLANLFAGGVEKLSHDGRLGFVDNHLDDIFDSAENPIGGNHWWLTAEDPFQCLAACIDLSEALKSSSPHTFISRLPVHQDGSCNGLQHYAALGRDSLEAAAVNLVAREKPADVYSEIAVRVHDIMERDSQKDPSTYPKALLAKILINQVDRKLVKQTVMTSVYGVTYTGARQQIKRRLEEKGLINDDKTLFAAASYATKVTLDALGELFQAARGIMAWLGDCAKVIASKNQTVKWTTPLGLPVVQPYCNSERHIVRTSLQTLSLQREGNSVQVKKQRTAFPPNFVHSLDGSHMMLTAVACRDAGIHFAGVHDSFWTHARNVDEMNRILREQFVELYSMPILENLLESFQRWHPDLVFPPLPKRGNFDLNQVVESSYFFN